MNSVIDAARYPASIFWSDEDEGYIAVAPDLQGCSAFGETPSQALSELWNAITAWTEAARNAGNRIPEPSRPPLEPYASGKILVRMPRSLHLELGQGAKRDNVSLNQYVVYLLTTAHTTHQTVRNLSAALAGSAQDVWAGGYDFALSRDPWSGDISQSIRDVSTSTLSLLVQTYSAATVGSLKEPLRGLRLATEPTANVFFHINPRGNTVRALPRHIPSKERTG